uniref:Uncharacterized protein n=1 Tax=Tanacetum cinerariifolium TaxID=118510 RepID=A0A699RYN2_TANCI|nr:hypothetical protein [Tanacetum cinerariifolium]
MLAGVVDSAGYFFAHHRAHRAANKAEVHRGHYQRLASAEAVGSAHGIFEARAALGSLHALRVSFGIHEVERVGRGQVGVKLLKHALIKEQLEVRHRVDAVVVAAVAAHVAEAAVLGHAHHRFALGALVPEAVGGFLFLLGGSNNALFLSLKPSHNNCEDAVGPAASARYVLAEGAGYRCRYGEKQPATGPVGF